MQFASRAAFAVVCLAVLSGCSSISGGDLIRAGEGTGTIEVDNQTSYPIDVVLISDCSNFTYGTDNRLPSGTAISPGGSYPFAVSAGCWDVAAGSFGVGDARQRLTVDAGGITRYTVTD